MATLASPALSSISRKRHGSPYAKIDQVDLASSGGDPCTKPSARGARVSHRLAKAPSPEVEYPPNTGGRHAVTKMMTRNVTKVTSFRYAQSPTVTSNRRLFKLPSSQPLFSMAMPWAAKDAGATSHLHGPPGDASKAQTAGRKAEAGSLARCFSRHEVAAELSTPETLPVKQGDASAQKREARPKKGRDLNAEG